MTSCAGAACAIMNGPGVHACSQKKRTRLVCIVASFLRSSEPRFAIARVDSVKS